MSYTVLSIVWTLSVKKKAEHFWLFVPVLIKRIDASGNLKQHFYEAFKHNFKQKTIY